MIRISLLFLILFSWAIHAEEPARSSSQTHYAYVSRDHDLSESAGLVGGLFVLNWAGYYLTQPDVIREHGSWDNYKKNFGQHGFDKDAEFWNFMVHPYVGSQLYLFYRSRGYTNQGALLMTTIQSTLFEEFIEIYTEHPSIQDLYQTPVIGSILGFGLERLSLYLLNGGTTWGKIVGHTINPWTLFDFFETRVQIVPHVENHRVIGAQIVAEF